MIPIHGVYEVVIRVKDLERAERFYMETLGLESGLRVDARRMHFLRVAGDAGMLVLQEDTGEWPTQHYAFTTTDGEIDAAVGALRARGVESRGPVKHDWMPARSLYFDDPDGHELELCAPLGAGPQ